MGKKKRVSSLEEEVSHPSFWQRDDAQELIRKLAEEKKEIESWQELEKEITDLEELCQLSSEDLASLTREIEEKIETLSSKIEKWEFRLLFRGEYDSRGAILALHSGAGGTESQDWAQMLLRMYIRWAEKKGYKVEVLEINPGEEAGIKSALLEITGEYAYGYLKAEHGVHRLVRLSPFDADHARHTSFALVEVLPQAEKDIDIKIDPKDLRIETFRASGPGGQHMQKTNTAVRITHLPTGITVSYQGQRSQYQNKETALKILRAKLLEMELKRKAEERAKLKGEHLPASWGNQIRSYILHPYKLVKDHRTEYEESDAFKVLDGEIDGFIKAYLRSKISQQ